jgi:hypothetical protein
VCVFWREKQGPLSLGPRQDLGEDLLLPYFPGQLDALGVGEWGGENRLEPRTSLEGGCSSPKPAELVGLLQSGPTKPVLGSERRSQK